MFKNIFQYFRSIFYPKKIDPETKNIARISYVICAIVTIAISISLFLEKTKTLNTIALWLCSLLSLALVSLFIDSLIPKKQKTIKLSNILQITILIILIICIGISYLIFGTFYFLK